MIGFSPYIVFFFFAIWCIIIRKFVAVYIARKSSLVLTIGMIYVETKAYSFLVYGLKIGIWNYRDEVNSLIK